MLKINFTVNEHWLEYFKNKLSKKTSLNSILRDSDTLKKVLESMWSRQEKTLFNILSIFFSSEEKLEFTVEVFPEYFYLGAINLERRIILLWQPNHSQNYYIWLLGHELAHYLMKWRYMNRMVEEVICFFLERKILEEIDHVNSEDISYLRNISKFHLRAISYVNEYYNEFDQYYKRKDLNGLFEYLNNIVNLEDKNISISSNITSYIESING